MEEEETQEEGEYEEVDEVPDLAARTARLSDDQKAQLIAELAGSSDF